MSNERVCRMNIVIKTDLNNIRHLTKVSYAEYETIFIDADRQDIEYTVIVHTKETSSDDDVFPYVILTSLNIEEYEWEDSDPHFNEDEPSDNCDTFIPVFQDIIVFLESQEDFDISHGVVCFYQDDEIVTL